jgi:hypothetical protein
LADNDDKTGQKTHDSQHMTGRKDSLDKSAGTKQYGKYNKDKTVMTW